jgi:hypothetical protein
MSLYMYKANNNSCRDGKLHFFVCNECGNVDLKEPRDSESDHMDVLRFTCNKCGINPYWHWMGIYDVIIVTKKNKDELLREYCEDHEMDTDYTWRQSVIDIMDEE